MLRFLPVVLVITLVIGGLGYWRFIAARPALTTPETTKENTQESDLVEVPKTLPQASIEDRVKALEDLTVKLVEQINSLKSASKDGKSGSPDDAKLNLLDASVTELKMRVSALEKATPQPVSSTSKSSTVYIPLGSGGTSDDANWYSLSGYEISMDPGEYSGYTGMQLEVSMKLNEKVGTANARLLNSSDNSAVSSEVTTTSDSFTLLSTGGFKLPAGRKTYQLQLKSSQNRTIQLQNARIKVNF